MTGDPARAMNAVFPHKVCINLDRRADRWQQMLSKFAHHDIFAVRRFPAMDGEALILPPNWSGTAGGYGCLLSHLQVVREARELGVPSVLIFEDDVVFDTALQDKFSAYISQVPEHWDMLYFGALHMEDPIIVSEHVNQIRRAYSTYAYALNRTIFDVFIDLNSKADTAVDVNNLQLQTEHKCYCFRPHLAWVETDYSDAQELQKNHWYLKESLVIHGTSMNQLLNQTSLIIAHKNTTRNSSITQNLLFLARFYSQRLPGISIVIVEQDLETTIDLRALPKRCLYYLLRDGGLLNRGLCFNTGMNISDPNHPFIIFSDNDIFLEEWDICGNLRMCERYDCTTGLKHIIELTSSDTLKLKDDRAVLMRWFEAAKYSINNHSRRFGNYCVFNRSSILAAGGWEEEPSKNADTLLSLRGGQQLRIFEAPNYALRLHPD